MLFVQLDTNWVHNPKIIRAGMDGAGLHATCLCLAKSLDTDGWIDLLILGRYGATGELIERLVDLELLERDGERVRPHDWLDRNPSKAALAAKRAAKVRAGKAGNHSRYGHPGPLADCSLCGPDEPETPSVLAPAIAEPRNDLASSRTDPRSYTNPTGASPPATALTPEQIELNRRERQAIRSEHPFLTNGAAAS